MTRGSTKPSANSKYRSKERLGSRDFLGMLQVFPSRFARTLDSALAVVQDSLTDRQASSDVDVFQLM